MTPATSDTPQPDEQIEAMLNRHNVKFTLRNVPLTSIDVKASRANQARDEALDPETSDNYAQVYRMGQPMPPLIVFPRGKQFVIIDGNHRDAGARKVNVRTHAAYVLDKGTPTEIIELLTAIANAKHGKPTSVRWRIRQAIYLIATQGWSLETAAAELIVSPQAISKAIRVERADQRAEKLGVHGWLELSPSNREALGRITSDPVFVAAARVAIDTDWRTGLSEFITELRKLGSEAAQMQYIGTMQDERELEKARVKAIGKRTRNIANPKNTVLSALGMVMAIKPEDMPYLFKTDREREEISRRCGDAAIRLMEMEAALRSDESNGNAA